MNRLSLTAVLCGAMPACALVAADAPDAEALSKQIEQLMRDPAPNRDQVDYMTAMADRRERVIGLVDTLLRRDPKTPRRDELLAAKLESMYIVAVIRAQPLGGVEAEARRILALGPSGALVDYAAYLVMQIEIARHRRSVRKRSLPTRASATQGKPPAAPSPVTTARVIEEHDRFKLERYQSYVAEHPKSRFAPPLLADLVEDAWERADAFSVREHLTQLERHHPDHVETRRILAAHRTRQAIGKPLAFMFEDLAGKAADTAALRGKVVLVVFWATWCPKCREQMPRLNSLGRRLGPRGLRIVGVSLDDSRAALVEFVKRESIDWPQCFDGRQWDGDLAKRFGVRSLPTSLVIDKSGTLRAVGLRGIEALIDRLLAEGPTK